MTVITSRKWVLLCYVCVWKGGLFGNLYVAEKKSSLEHHAYSSLVRSSSPFPPSSSSSSLADGMSWAISSSISLTLILKFINLEETRQDKPSVPFYARLNFLSAARRAPLRARWFLLDVSKKVIINCYLFKLYILTWSISARSLFSSIDVSSFARLSSARSFQYVAETVSLVSGVSFA